MNIAISVAEPSADLLAGQLIAELKKQKNTHCFGLAGSQMKQAGCQILWHSEQVAVMGFSEVLAKLPRLLSLRKQMLAEFLRRDCDVFIGVDAPDFNFYLARKLKQKGIKTVHFVSPSVWAWRAWRVKKIKKSVDLMLCLFPFETAFYHQNQINALFVGHPLTKMITPRTHYQKNNTLALLPGSRQSELKRHLPVMIASAKKLRQSNDKLTVYLPLVAKSHQKLLTPYQDLDWLRVSVANAHDIIKQVDVVITASGTASLEVALSATPMVVIYKMSWFSFLLAKWLVKIPFISLPNIIAGKKLVPELLQKNANANNISQAVHAVLKQDYPSLRAQLIAIYTQLDNGDLTAAATAVLSDD